ncbi:aminoglycoside phosphotransferase family protein [Aeromicrobium sp. UC242_57]|uniref:aminoglycoside phosphotransferase family protein n=1 Tax=Aeromicrobium sp. UC242_57 TaxID=3374624 RepID=UPI00379838F0
MPRRIVEQAIRLGRSFVDDPDSVGRLIHADLHYENVLAAERAPWLAIDPKPVSGDPHYEVAPLLWNRWDEAVATGDVRACDPAAVPHDGRRSGSRRGAGP